MAPVATAITFLKPLAASHGIRAALVAFALCLCAPFASAGPLDEMDIKRWEKLKEAERFQLNSAERLYREAPMLLIGEGTAEIQKMIIGRRLLEEYRFQG